MHHTVSGDRRALSRDSALAPPHRNNTVKYVRKVIPYYSNLNQNYGAGDCRLPKSA